LISCTQSGPAGGLGARVGMQGGTKPVARDITAVLPAARIVAQRSPCLPVCYRCLTTQRSINTTAAAHAAISTGTPAASASPAPSSAGPIANKSNARRPAPPMKAGLGKSFIAIGRLIAPPQKIRAPAGWARSADLSGTRRPDRHHGPAARYWRDGGSHSLPRHSGCNDCCRSC
jgi:hypothetical protein